MSSSQSGKSKWGMTALLQQAVSGVESRLDTILANDEDLPKKPAKDEQKPAVSRSASTARRNDRLQERLARAMAKTQSSSVNSPPSSASAPSPASTPGPEVRSSFESARASLDDAGHIRSKSTDRTPHSARSSQSLEQRPRVSNDLSRNDQGDVPKKDQSDDVEPVQSTDARVDSTTMTDNIVRTSPAEETDSALSRLQAEHAAAEQQWQEEMHHYIEKIDALQSKLKYLAKEAAESAREASAAAGPGSLERQLAEKDERIALLMEEGQKLSKVELDNRTLIKRLRQQIAENNKNEQELKRRTAKLEKDLVNAEARAKRAEAAERRAQESLGSQSKVAKDLAAVTSERDSLSAMVEELRGQLARAVARAEAAESKAQADALEKSQRQIKALEDDLANAKIEREISEEKLRREIRDLKDSLEREKEGARVLEAELKSEQSVLESKMESLRAKAEEVSSSTAGDAQAKLLRQIETLQTQYAVASENWHGIESSLLSRLASVEKERDEIAQKEADLRRKAREMSLKAKKAEEELETTKEAMDDLNRSLQESMQEVEKLKQRVEKTEKELATARTEAQEKEKAIEAAWTQKLEEERARWREQMPSPSSFLQEPRAASPVASSRRSMNLEPLGPDSRPVSRRSSTLPVQVAEAAAPSRTNSLPTFNNGGSPNPSNPNLLLAPSIQTLEPEEYFTGPTTPATPPTQGAPTIHSRGGGANDIISVSTVGAGPSVQLVERMSATVRRLESERAATKEELARITEQRDEARREIVELMREVEEKRKADSRVAELEAQVADLDQRYQTTLELLGEKTEQVEELQADIADLKKIYRELVDSTMK